MHKGFIQGVVEEVCEALLPGGRGEFLCERVGQAQLHKGKSGFALALALGAFGEAELFAPGG